MSISGAEPQRLTYHVVSCVVARKEAGERIIFRSSIKNILKRNI